MVTEIETIFIMPSKEMPFEIFSQLYRTSYYMELMEHLPNGNVLWDETFTSIFDQSAAEVHYAALQADAYCFSMELPVVMVNRLKNLSQAE